MFPTPETIAVYAPAGTVMMTALSRSLAGASPAALAIKHGCLMFSESFAERSACTTYPIAHKPCVAVPLLGDGRSLGALEVRGGSDYSWRSADLEALLALAKQAAIAIENAQRTNIEFDQLYAALQSRADHWTHASWCPATPGRAQQPEATFVLEHQPHAAASLSLAPDLVAYGAAQFF